ARLEHFLDDRLGADLARALQACPAAGCLVILKTQRAGAPGAGEGQALLALDEGMCGDRADALIVRTAIEDGADVARGRAAPANSVDLDQRFEPLHAPTAGALDQGAGLEEGGCKLVSPAGAGEGIVGNADGGTGVGHAFSINLLSAAPSSRA